MNVLDLFSGIGGFSLGLERAGMRTVAFCEVDPFCRRVLAKHWPSVPIYPDVRELSAQHITADGISVDVICGGFPCQDLSTAGKRAGITGERSGLWGELHRLIGELRPEFAIVENVPNLLTGERGAWFGHVLGSLAEIGFDAVWHCIPASILGAPHIRDRVWIVASPNASKDHFGAISQVLADNTYAGRNRSSGWGAPMPPVSRLGDGIPGELDRLGALGNSVVPQIPEIIGRAIMTTQTSRER
jgi:DNA (cytosine-5)-methyltransferase 1